MSNLTDDEVDLLSPFIWGGWIGVAKGKEAAFSRDLRATVERIVADRERAARVEALREAANRWQTGSWAVLTPAIKAATQPQRILGAAQVVCDYLRERADQEEAPNA